VKQLQPRKTYRKHKTVGTIDYYYAYKDLGGSKIGREDFHKPLNDLVRGIVTVAIKEDIEIYPLYVSGRFGVRMTEAKNGVPNWAKSKEIWIKKYGTDRSEWKKHNNKPVVYDYDKDYAQMCWMSRFKNTKKSAWYFLKRRLYAFYPSVCVKQKIFKYLVEGQTYFYK